MGAITTGQERGTPSNEVVRSIWRTSTRMSWRMARRRSERRLRRSVVSVSVPPAPKLYEVRGRRARAARWISGSVTKGSVMAGTIMPAPRECNGGERQRCP